MNLATVEVGKPTGRRGHWGLSAQETLASAAEFRTRPFAENLWTRALEEYLHPSHCLVAIELSQSAKRALIAAWLKAHLHVRLDPVLLGNPRDFGAATDTA